MVESPCSRSYLRICPPGPVLFQAFRMVEVGSRITCHVILRVAVGMPVYNRFDRDGDRDGRAHHTTACIAPQAVLYRRLVQRDDHDDRRWVYALWIRARRRRETPSAKRELRERERSLQSVEGSDKKKG